MVIKFKRKSAESIKDVGNSDMNACLTHKMRGNRVVGGGGAVFPPGIIQFGDDFDETE
jgi:hypothetical protein